MDRFRDRSYLSPGDLMVKNNSGKLVTTLGSCVSVTAWHSNLKVGAMCHYLLPKLYYGRSQLHDNNFGDLALENLRACLIKIAPLAEFDFGVFGGASLFINNKKANVGEKNVEMALDWATQNKINFYTSCTLGTKSRRVCLYLNNGCIDNSQIDNSDLVDRHVRGKLVNDN